MLQRPYDRTTKHLKIMKTSNRNGKNNEEIFVAILCHEGL